MANRREFQKKVRVQIIKRATKQIGDEPGVTAQFCEECHCLALRFEIHHIEPDGLVIDKSKALTADEGELLCKPCHKIETDKNKAQIAQAVRREARHIGAVQPKGTIKSAGFRKTEKPARVSRPVANGVPGLFRQYVERT